MESALRRPEFWISLLVPLIAIASLPFEAGDLSGWTALGLRALESGALQTRDTFSVLPTQDLVYPAWLPSLIYGQLYPRIGLALLAALHWIFPAAILAWLHWSFFFGPRARTVSVFQRLLLYMVWIAVIPVFGERPAVWSFPLVLLSFHRVSLLRFDSGPMRPRTLRIVLELTLLEVAWANLHGSFLLLPAMAAWRGGVIALRRLLHRQPEKAAEAAARTAGLLGTLLGAACLNPFGWAIFGYVADTARISRSRAITEWESTWPWVEPPVGALHYLLVLGLAFLVWKRVRARGWQSAFAPLASPFVVVLGLAFTGIRHVPLEFLLLVPFLWRHFREELFGKKGIVAPLDETPERGKWAIAALLLAAWVALWPPYKPSFARLLPESRAQTFSGEYPEKLLARIASSGKSACPVFAEMELGGALMLSVPNPGFLDMRNVIFGDEDFARVSSALRGEAGWNEVLDSTGACFAVVDESRFPVLLARLSESPAWSSIFRQGRHVLFERRD